MPNDRITWFECQYDLINNTAMQDATFTSTTVKGFCDLSKLVDTPEQYRYMTMEHDYSVLDNSLSEFPDVFETPYFSSEMSDENGEFETTPYLDISFTQPQSSYGFTFYFEENYPLELKVSLLNDADLVLKEYTLIPDGLVFVASVETLDYKKVHIEFTKAMPHRYIKLVGFVFGRTMYWTENEIRQGTLLLEKDPLSNLLSINTLNFEVIDKNNEYNIANDVGLHRYFQKKQVAYAYEYVNGNKLLLGKYFLDNFSWDKNLVKLNCVSYMGILDDVDYMNGDIYNGTLAGTILEDIFNIAGIYEYVIDDETYNTPVYGSLKPMKCREAIREVLFACNSGISTATEDSIEISKISNILGETIYRSNKISTKITKNDYIYGVEMQYTTYSLSEETKDIIKEEEYPKGKQILTFTEAYTDIQITDANDNPITPTVVKKYYVEFELSSDTTITVTGRPYLENESTIKVTRDYLESGESETIKSYTTSLCNAKMARNRALDILNYLSNRLTLNIQTITSDLNMNGRRWVENPSKDYSDFIAWYTQRSFDLTGGFIDTAKMVGYYYYEYVIYYAGDEIYSGENIGII